MTLTDILAEAKKQQVAIPHFNVSTLEALHGIAGIARDTRTPLIIGLSEGERDFIGISSAVHAISEYRKQGVPVFLNADHTYSVARVQEAIDAGFDAVIIDGAKLDFDANVAQTKVCVDYARASGKSVFIEAELGYIGSSSKILDALPENTNTEDTLTTAEKAVDFVTKTGIDFFAPAVGNVHGMMRSAPNPHLDIARIQAIAQSVSTPLVLHGGSGTTDEDFVKAIEAGIRIIHVSTELRIAYRQGIMSFLAENPDEVAPYKYIKQGVKAMVTVAEARAQLFTAGKLKA